ncbi:MAG: hypothetical protein WD767_05595 [Alphaproteobacteria bacterium]
MHAPYSYEAALKASRKIAWEIEDIIGGEKRLDFDRPFLPEALAGVQKLDFLGPDEQRCLNHIRAHGYLYTFGMVEEFILPFVLDHARPQLHGDDFRARALLQFAAEEAKHIHLFKRFREEFTSGFGSECEVIGPPEEIARAVLSHHPLGVSLIILHIEWMTQRHYTGSVREDRDIDPLFSSLLRHHWMEEAQHARLDTLMVESLAEVHSAAEIAEGIDAYLAIGGMIDDGLKQQAEFDVDALTRATGRHFDTAERDRLLAAQQRALRWTFIGSGMTHPNFLATVERLDPPARRRLETEVAPAFC